MKKLLLELFGPSSVFTPGDSVELLQGGQLMVVRSTGLDPTTGEKVVFCSSFDQAKAISVTRTFKEKDLKLIDWYGTRKI